MSLDAAGSVEMMLLRPSVRGLVCAWFLVGNMAVAVDGLPGPTGAKPTNPIGTKPLVVQDQYEHLTALVPLTLDTKREAEVYWSGLMNSAERFESGVCTATGIISSGSVPLGGQHRFFLAFDRQSQSIRFDHREGDNRQTKVVRTPRETLIYGEGGIILRQAPHAPINIADAEPFNIDLLGLYGFGDFSNRVTADDIYRLVSKVNLAECVHDKDGLVRLTFVMLTKEKAERRKSIWIDPKRGYRPVRLTNHRRESGQADYLVASRAQTEWTEVRGAWVPVSFVALGLPLYKLELSLNWSSVNAPIEPKVFSLNDFDARAGTTIMDNRLGRLVLDGIVAGPQQSGPQANGNRSGKSTRWIILLAVNCTLIGLIVSVQLYRLRRRNQPKA
jgi:hypothetical protein